MHSKQLISTCNANFNMQHREQLRKLDEHNMKRVINVFLVIIKCSPAVMVMLSFSVLVCCSPLPRFPNVSLFQHPGCQFPLSCSYKRFGSEMSGVSCQIFVCDVSHHYDSKTCDRNKTVICRDAFEDHRRLKESRTWRLKLYIFSRTGKVQLSLVKLIQLSVGTDISNILNGQKTHTLALVVAMVPAYRKHSCWIWQHSWQLPFLVEWKELPFPTLFWIGLKIFFNYLFDCD